MSSPPRHRSTGNPLEPGTSSGERGEIDPLTGDAPQLGQALDDVHVGLQANSVPLGGVFDLLVIHCSTTTR